MNILNKLIEIDIWKIYKKYTLREEEARDLKFSRESWKQNGKKLKYKI